MERPHSTTCASYSYQHMFLILISCSASKTALVAPIISKLKKAHVLYTHLTTCALYSLIFGFTPDPAKWSIFYANCFCIEKKTFSAYFWKKHMFFILISPRVLHTHGTTCSLYTQLTSCSLYSLILGFTPDPAKRSFFYANFFLRCSGKVYDLTFNGNTYMLVIFFKTFFS